MIRISNAIYSTEKIHIKKENKINKNYDKNKITSKKKIKSKNPITKVWDHIPHVTSLNNGLLLDGYWADDFQGFNCILYDSESNRLVRWLDTTIIPTARYRGRVPQKLCNRPIKYYYLHNLLNGKDEIISEVPVSEIGYRRNINVKNFSQIETNISQEQLYFHIRQISPGVWYKIIDNQIIMKETKIDIEGIKAKLIGESTEIIELCVNNMPLLEAPIGHIKRAAFDIEVRAPRGIFPVPSEAEYDIHAVAFYDSDGNAFMYYHGLHLTSKELINIKKELGYLPEIYVFPTENSLLSAVFNKMQEYPILLSFNGDNFDMPYMLNRAKRLNLEGKRIHGAHYKKIDCPIAEGHYRSKQREYQVRGVIHVDLFRFFNNQAVRLYAYGGKYDRNRLDDIAEALLGKKKITHDLWFDEMTRDQMVIYNTVDVELTLQLTTFSNELTWNLMLILMRVGKFTITYLNRESISKWILNWIAYEHRRRGLLMPTKKEILEIKGDFTSSAGIDGKQYQGAIVLQAKKGVFWNVTVADFASLYPSVIKKFRLSYETIRCDHPECKNNSVPSLDHWVCTKQQGLMSSLVGYVRDIRVKWYKQKSKSKDPGEKLFAKTIQAALKVFINASYGVFGTENFALFCPPLAESTTAYARSALLEAKSLAENMNIPVLYGDTDSIFIHNPTEEQFATLKIWSVVELGIELGIDYKFRFLVLSGRKKNYFGITEEGKVIVKGLRVKKRNTSIFIKKVFQQIVDKFLGVNNQQELDEGIEFMISLLKKTISKLRKHEIPLEQLTNLVTLNKPFGEYTALSSAVQIALQKITPENEGEIKQGSQFEVIKIKPQQIVIKTRAFKHFRMGSIKTISVRAIEDVVSYNEIDVDKYVELLKKAFIPIFESFDLSWDEVMNEYIPLEQYF